MRLPLGDGPVIVEFFGYGLEVQGVAALVYDADNEPLPLEIVELPFGRVLVVNPGTSRDLLAQPSYGQLELKDAFERGVVVIVATLRVVFSLLGR